MNTAKSFLVAAFCLMPAVAWAGDGVGSLKELTGKAHVTHVAANQTAPQDMKLGDPLFEHDVVETEEGARAVFHFADEAELVVTGKGKLVVDEYIYDAAKKTGNGAVLDILGTAFSYAGGLMDKGENTAVKLNMNYGSIGIRGTKVMGVLRNGLDWVYLEEGVAAVNNKGGEVLLALGFGTRLSADTETPAPAYKWGETEIAWIKRLVDDPAAHEMQSMASNISPRQLKAPEDASDRKDSAPGGPSGGGAKSNALDNLAPRDEEDVMGGKAAPAAPAASAPAPAAEPVSPAKEQAPARAREAEETVVKTKASEPSQDLIKQFNEPLWGTALSRDADGNLRIDTTENVTIHLLDAVVQKNDALKLSVNLKVLEMSGIAYIESHAHYRGEKDWVTVERAPPLNGMEDWQELVTEFKSKKDADADVTFDLVVHGGGKLLVRDMKATSIAGGAK